MGIPKDNEYNGCFVVNGFFLFLVVLWFPAITFILGLGTMLPLPFQQSATSHNIHGYHATS